MYKLVKLFGFPLLILAVVFLLTRNSILTNDKADAPIIEEAVVKDYSTYPGEVANVFGWGYNRTSCYIKEISDTIIFFYAEDQNIYYTFHSDPKVYFKIENFPAPQNPDFDVNCNDNSINLTISDVNQQYIYFIEGSLIDKAYKIIKSELVYDGKVAYNAVAPHMRYYEDVPYIAFMEYGRVDTHTPNSKVYISKRINNNWETAKIFEYPATKNQVLGISLELYQNQLLAFIHPNDKGIYIAKLLDTGIWTDPKAQSILNATGHLEWQSHVDSNGILHLVFGSDNGKISHGILKNNTWNVWRLPEDLSINTRNVFEIPSKGVFIIYNTGILRQVLPGGISKSVQINELSPTESNLFFLRVASMNLENVNLVWLEGEYGSNTIEYRSFNISDYYTNLNLIDNSIPMEVESLVIENL